MVEAGVVRGKPLVDQVRSQSDPQRIRELISVFRTYHEARGWSPAALYDRVKIDVPEMAEMDGWPDSRAVRKRPKKPEKPKNWEDFETRYRCDLKRQGLSIDEIDDRVAAAKIKFAVPVTIPE